MKKKEKCLIIVDEKNKLYGAFFKTEKGKKEAQRYLKKINKEKNLKIIEK